MLPVLFQSGSTDDLNLTPCHGRFQNIRGIHGSLGTSCTNDRMKLINKQKNISVLTNLIDHILNTLLKLATIFGPGYHSRQIQNTQPSAPDRIRYFSCCDPGCQSFHNGSLTDPGLPDQTRIVLSPAA